ncbi:VCBS repeat protein [Prauserella shujinwangii]|uniref:VCBS repeat protein n=1 Tax=Prauserella shujinwangii TaxID=1453103 RepID=A0A2T0LNJ6_9PSEU|nr:CRTAC1 family protein [Prauserella shujinwangii]PRX44681.1 VCBS repeat protein [Prauserella shujinwangii]
MRSSLSWLRRRAAALVAILCCVLTWQLAQLPATSAEERQALAERYAFATHPVSPPDRPGDRQVRPVAPVYEHIEGWVSSVGASTALLATDGGTVSRDICLVDPRTDTVTIRPAPTTGQRFPAFELHPEGLPYESYVAPMGCLPADYNEDGWQDVVVYYWGRSPVVFLREPDTPQAADGFTARELVSPPQIWNTNAASIADFDGDGHVDLFFGNYFPDGARVLDPTADQASLVMTDSLSNAYNAGTHRIFRFADATASGPPDIRFVEDHDAFDGTEETGWTLAAGTQDISGDGLADLYIGNDFAPDQLLVNESVPGDIRFREVHGERHALTPKSKVVGQDSFKGMGVAFGDVNADGATDLVVSNITDDYALHESNFAFVRTGGDEELERGIAPFDDHAEDLGLSRTGWTWDVKIADFANSGSPDVLFATGFLRGDTNRWAQMQEAAMSNDLIMAHPGLWPRFADGADLSGHDPNKFFTRGPDGRYVEIGDLAGVGTDAVSRAFAVGDVDTDGRLDFVAANQWTQSTFYRNESAAGDFLGLRLRQPARGGDCEGTESGRTRPAIGARATVSPEGRTALTQQVYPANGHNGVNAPDLHFGLGEAAGPLPVTVTWRTACGQTRSDTLELTPGWHELLLNADGKVQEVR